MSGLYVNELNTVNYLERKTEELERRLDSLEYRLTKLYKILEIKMPEKEIEQ